MAEHDHPEDDYRKRLTPEQYRITREGATEPAFSGEYWDDKGPGTYLCVCCRTELFRSDDKYDSGSGWPSFTRPAREEAVVTAPDRSLAMTRTEVRCRRCDAHLGHVFEDGPDPTGLRYCINSGALSKEEPETG